MKPWRNSKGYTLIEMALVVAIVGVMIATAVNLVQRKTEAERYRTTLERMDKIETALQGYFEQNRYLPCPADGEQQVETSATFGVSVGYTSPNCDDAPNNKLGVVPVRTLGLPDAMMYDGWGRKFSYQLASGLADADDFADQDNKGDISVRDLDGYELTLLNYDGNYGAAYVLFSHGRNGLRAWLPNVPGVDAVQHTVTDAATTDALLGVEIENVDGDSSFIQDFTSQDFDDILHFKTKSDIYELRRLISPLRISSRACQSARAVINVGLDTYETGYSAHAAVITKAALALDKLCDSDAAPIVDTCAGNLSWLGPSDLTPKTYQDCHCVTDDQFYRTGFQNEMFGGCE